jgi:transcription termination factor Rho
MSEPVLERSVLERKERDELLTIARAMGASPASRIKKADLVDLILTAAGIPSGGGPDAPGAEDERPAKLDDASTSEPVAAGPGAAADEAGRDPDGSPDGDDARPAAPEPGEQRDGGGDERRPRRDQGGRGGRGGDGGPRGEERGGRDQAEGRGRPAEERTRGNGDERPQERGEEREASGPSDDGDEDAGNRRRRRRGRDQRPQGADDAFLGEPVEVAGLLDLRDEGYGFLRTKGYLASRDDVYVSVKQVRQFGLRKGDHLTGASRPANRNEKNPALLRIDEVNGKDPEQARRRPRFEDLTPLFPDERLRLETGTATGDMTARIVDLVAPIGKGQRGLVVSPPKAGKTTILKQIVRSIERNNPEVDLMVLLVDERPEEVTDMRRSTTGEVVASTFDRPTEEHIAVAELVIERARRMVEDGRDVVIVLDGITRLARAYNLAAPATGRIMSGGVDSGALYPPKRFFGSARNIEEGGSLTILATALVETGSKMDEVIFEEFKGTGNMELRLDRRLAERRIYPAIDVSASSTRHEELLFDRTQLQQVWRVRRALHALSTEAGSPAAALERLLDGMKTFRSNAEFLAEAAKAGGA